MGACQLARVHWAKCVDYVICVKLFFVIYLFLFVLGSFTYESIDSRPFAITITHHLSKIKRHSFILLHLHDTRSFLFMRIETFEVTENGHLINVLRIKVGQRASTYFLNVNIVTLMDEPKHRR